MDTLPIARLLWGQMPGGTSDTEPPARSCTSALKELLEARPCPGREERPSWRPREKGWDRSLSDPGQVLLIHSLIHSFTQQTRPGAPGGGRGKGSATCSHGVLSLIGETNRDGRGETGRFRE
uniref:Uncharacterized protein n=1 Tax=Pipistrellus kuhlii TaxID=59472 RepID=A0A7J7T139_PIPKU|nr:hypothetical protein mPipKuh1_009734 [Pipistrellus kuhlii]